VFIHLLPEIFLPQTQYDESESAPHVVFVEPRRNTILGATIFLGFATFFLMEKFFRILGDGDGGHGHSHSHSHPHSHPDASSSESTAVSTTVSSSEIRHRGKKEKPDGPADGAAASQTAASQSKDKVKLSAYLNLIADATHSKFLRVFFPSL
jgi:zinc transporter 7